MGSDSHAPYILAFRALRCLASPTASLEEGASTAGGMYTTRSLGWLDSVAGGARLARRGGAELRGGMARARGGEGLRAARLSCSSEQRRSSQPSREGEGAIKSVSDVS